MDGQIPDDVHVALEQPEVHARRVVIVEVAEGPIRDQLADFAHGRRVDKRVIDHQDEIAPRRLLNQDLGLGRSLRHWLLDQHMLARLQRGERDLEMAGDRRGDENGIDRRIGDQSTPVAVVVARQDGASSRVREPSPRNRQWPLDRHRSASAALRARLGPQYP